MEHPEICLKEHEWGMLDGTLRRIEDYMERNDKRVSEHIHEGEREGGVRDQARETKKELDRVKEEVRAIKVYDRR